MSLKISYVTKHILTNCYWDLIPTCKSVKYLFYIFMYMYYSVLIHSSLHQKYTWLLSLLQLHRRPLILLIRILCSIENVQVSTPATCYHIIITKIPIVKHLSVYQHLNKIANIQYFVIWVIVKNVFKSLVMACLILCAEKN